MQYIPGRASRKESKLVSYGTKAPITTKAQFSG